MKKVIWTDKIGWKRVSMLRDKDPDNLAPQGIPVDTVDVRGLDWEAVQRVLNNELVDRGLLNLADVHMQGGLLAAVNLVIRRQIMEQMKLSFKEGKK